MPPTLEWNGCFFYFLRKATVRESIRLSDYSLFFGHALSNSRGVQKSWLDKMFQVSCTLIPGYSLQQKTPLQQFLLRHNSVWLFMLTEYRSLTLRLLHPAASFLDLTCCTGFLYMKTTKQLRLLQLVYAMYARAPAVN